MEQFEKEIVSEAAIDALASGYALLLLAQGFEGAGNAIASKVYPALLEVGFIPPVGLKIDPAALGPRGKQLYAAMRGEEA